MVGDFYKHFNRGKNVVVFLIAHALLVVFFAGGNPAFLIVVIISFFRELLHFFVNGAGDYFVLLLFGEFVEVHRISAYPYGELRVFFGVFLRV